MFFLCVWTCFYFQWFDINENILKKKQRTNVSIARKQSFRIWSSVFKCSFISDVVIESSTDSHFMDTLFGLSTSNAQLSLLKAAV